jgi:hypothetical protein
VRYSIIMERCEPVHRQPESQPPPDQRKNDDSIKFDLQPEIVRAKVSSSYRRIWELPRCIGPLQGHCSCVTQPSLVDPAPGDAALMQEFAFYCTKIASSSDGRQAYFPVFSSQFVISSSFDGLGRRLVHANATRPHQSHLMATGSAIYQPRLLHFVPRLSAVLEVQRRHTL